jgi:hypothetical protein
MFSLVAAPAELWAIRKLAINASANGLRGSWLDQIGRQRRTVDPARGVTTVNGIAEIMQAID